MKFLVARPATKGSTSATKGTLRENRQSFQYLYIALCCLGAYSFLKPLGKTSTERNEASLCGIPFTFSLFSCS